MTPAEILADYRARRLTYGDAYTRLAYAGDRDPRTTLLDHRPAPSGTAPQGWNAVLYPTTSTGATP